MTGGTARPAWPSETGPPRPWRTSRRTCGPNAVGPQGGRCCRRRTADGPGAPYDAQKDRSAAHVAPSARCHHGPDPKRHGNRLLVVRVDLGEITVPALRRGARRGQARCKQSAGLRLRQRRPPSPRPGTGRPLCRSPPRPVGSVRRREHLAAHPEVPAGAREALAAADPV